MRRGRKTNQITKVIKFLILGGRGVKRKFAVIMSAALAAGSTMPVMAESETAFTPSTYVGEFSLTADGESMLFSILQSSLQRMALVFQQMLRFRHLLQEKRLIQSMVLMMYFALFLVIFILMSLKLQVHMVNC